MVRNVVIVGGGSAGWMTAAYLSRALENLESITLIESETVRTVGVGEATFSTLKLFFDFLGLSEREWMPACNATYKMAIRFVDWTTAGGHFYHPFQRYEVVDGFNLGEWWLALPEEQRRPFDYSCFTIPELCDRKRSPRFLDGRVFDDKVSALFAAEPARRVLSDHRAQLPYGYHMDASLLAGFMKDY
ncbi:MAG TPA: tryptophan 7-halogenase, partial [Thermoanaerobaculia bacterium]